jgi:hypothetical protein
LSVSGRRDQSERCSSFGSRALLVLRERHAEVFLDQGGQADGWVAEELCADHRVIEIREFESAVALQDVDVVLGGMEEHAHLGRREDRSQRGQLVGAADGQRVDQPAFLAGRDLDQADLVEIVVEAVGFGVESDDVLFEQLFRDDLELFDGRDDLEVGALGPGSSLCGSAVVSLALGCGSIAALLPARLFLVDIFGQMTLVSLVRCGPFQLPLPMRDPDGWCVDSGFSWCGP